MPCLTSLYFRWNLRDFFLNKLLSVADTEDSTVSIQIKLENEGSDEDIETDVLYSPQMALKLALTEWLQEFGVPQQYSSELGLVSLWGWKENVITCSVLALRLKLFYRSWQSVEVLITLLTGETLIKKEECLVFCSVPLVTQLISRSILEAGWSSGISDLRQERVWNLSVPAVVTRFLWDLRE